SRGLSRTAEGDQRRNQGRERRSDPRRSTRAERGGSQSDRIPSGRSGANPRTDRNRRASRRRGECLGTAVGGSAPGHRGAAVLVNERPVMRALIADDDRIATEILASALKRMKIDVAVAHDGAAAWELLTAADGPSLAIIDWMMPALDGLELCRRIRRDAAHAHMYLILLTGRDDRQDVVAG